MTLQLVVKNGGGRWASTQPSQKVETVLGFLGYRAGVEGPGKVLHQVNA